ncbi:MAG: TonB-dependent receptor [Bacteroidota bacterium]
MKSLIYIRRSVAYLVCMCLFVFVKAQTYSVSGKFLSAQNAPVADAIIQLLKSSDSSLVKTEFTDTKGNFTFADTKQGSYLIQTNVLGYKSYLSPLITLNSTIQIPDITLEKSEVELKEVAVVARKPYIEREKGKVILNVENSINSAGSSAFELIEKAPGVRVDNNDNVSLNGKSGIAIWIDGKPTPMTGSDLANYLRGIPSSSIDKIEMISNPSARYDAAGSAIINIKLKKDKRVGTNGSISSSYGQGVYMKTNNSLSLNHRNKKINVFGSYNYAYREAFSHLKLDRRFYQNDTFIGAYNQDNYIKFDFNNHIARAGIDYFANKNNTFGFVVSGVSNKFNPKGDNSALVYDNTNTNSSTYKTTNRSKDNSYNYSANLNYKHSFDSLGTELSTDLDYAHFGNNTEQNFTTRYFDLDNEEYLNPYLLHGDINGDLNIYSIKNDFVKNLKKEYKLEAGQKSSYVVADNKLSFYNRSNSFNVFDSSKSNHFIYTENINAAYATVSKDYKKWSTQLGLRCEHTSVTGKQRVNNTSFINNYIQLFPSAFVGYKFSEKHGLEFNYSRRINRPSYEQLNPFKFYIDPTTYKEGNPYLMPQTTESFELTHVFKQKIYTTFGFGRTNKNITEVIAPDDNQPKITVQTNKNLAQVDVYALNCSLPVDVTKWWHITNEINSYYASYTGNVANTPIKNIGNLTFNLNMVNTFNFTSTFSGEVSGNYQAKEVYAFDVIKPRWFFNIGLQQKLWNNKATLKLNVNDVLYTNQTTADVTFTDYKENFVVRRDSRVLTIAFTYKFGKSSVPGSKRRQGGADDIKQRAGSGMG